MSHKLIEEKPTYVQIVTEALPQQLHSNEKSPFLGQAQLGQPQFMGQSNQQPFLGQKHQNHQVFLDLQNGQKRIMDLFVSMNQKMLFTLEKLNMQM